MSPERKHDGRAGRTLQEEFLSFVQPPKPPVEEEKKTVSQRPVREIKVFQAPTKPVIPEEVSQLGRIESVNPKRAPKPQKVSKFTELIRRITDMLY